MYCRGDWVQCPPPLATRKRGTLKLDSLIDLIFKSRQIKIAVPENIWRLYSFEVSTNSELHKVNEQNVDGNDACTMAQTMRNLAAMEA